MQKRSPPFYEFCDMHEVSICEIANEEFCEETPDGICFSNYRFFSLQLKYFLLIKVLMHK